MGKVTSGLLGILVLAFASPSYADDSSAALGAGGLVLTQSADIRMATEDFDVSPKHGPHPLRICERQRKRHRHLVAFVLPDIDTYKFWGNPSATTTTDRVNFVGFEVSATPGKLLRSRSSSVRSTTGAM